MINKYLSQTLCFLENVVIIFKDEKNRSAVVVKTGDLTRICKILNIFRYRLLHIKRSSIAFLDFINSEFIFRNQSFNSKIKMSVL